jgi:hypothetical protein
MRKLRVGIYLVHNSTHGDDGSVEVCERLHCLCTLCS